VEVVVAALSVLEELDKCLVSWRDRRCTVDTAEVKHTVYPAVSLAVVPDCLNFPAR
jgi:hypothetical protein